jgi:hypothetical protein
MPKLPPPPPRDAQKKIRVFFCVHVEDATIGTHKFQGVEAIAEKAVLPREKTVTASHRMPGDPNGKAGTGRQRIA